ncbi:MAG: hypothetical protein FD134_823 [Gallionellaceae bacterium]|nr:MAG: hypothetical protein FD134_823 [Gallionellaceae bacterium]
MSYRNKRGALLVVIVTALTAIPAFAASEPEPPRFQARGFEIEGELPIPREQAQVVLAPFVGESVGLEQLQGAAKALEAELSARGHAFYRVVLPPQTLEGSVVRLRVLPFKLAGIAVSGNHNFSNENVLASLPALRQGESPNVARVARNRAHVNEHPAKRVEVTFQQSRMPDAVDADVKVQDSPPLSVYASLQNTGEDRTGDWRATVGVRHGNLFDRDHALSASYTSSPGHWGDVRQYGMFYTVPFYAQGGSLTAFASYSNVNSGTIADAFQVSGGGKFFGARWKQHLVPVGAYSHSLEAGAEDRFFDNSVVFGAAQIGVNVRSQPLSLGYQGRYDMAGGSLGGSLGYARNLGGGGDNTDAAYLGNRAGAKRDWDAWRFSLEGGWALGRWTLGAQMQGQYADEPLIPGEQFGIGGAQSVRGLNEREASGENGHSLSLEASAPLPWEGARAVLFADNGEVWAKNPAAGQIARQDASSVGAGLRWGDGRRLSFTLDAAHVLNGTASTEAGRNRAHAALQVQF